MGESLRSAIARLRDAWPEHGCGAGDCCVRRWKDEPGSQPFYRLLDAARRVVEAPAPEPTTLDEALDVALDRAQAGQRLLVRRAAPRGRVGAARPALGWRRLPVIARRIRTSA